MKITREENCHIQEVEKAYKEGFRIYINGMGKGARKLYKEVFLSGGRNIPLEAFVVNDDYYDRILGKRELHMCGHPIIPMREIDLEDEHVFICIGYMHYGVL